MKRLLLVSLGLVGLASATDMGAANENLVIPTMNAVSYATDAFQAFIKNHPNFVRILLDGNGYNDDASYENLLIFVNNFNADLKNHMNASRSNLGKV